jgi:hypothetical protein
MSMKIYMHIDMAMFIDKHTDVDTDTEKEMTMDIRRFGCWILNIGKRFSLISDMVSESAIFSPISEDPIYQAKSDIVHQG